MTPRSAPIDRPRSDCLVMLGITGDLAKKKLIPAVYRLHRAGPARHPGRRSGPAGLERRRTCANHVRASIEDTGEKFDEDRVRRADGALGATSRATTTTSRPSSRLKTAVGHRRAPDLPHGHPAVDVRVRGRRPGRGRAQPGRPARRREAVRPRPRLGPRAERDDPGALRRVGRLPHRPLPRQGGDAQPAHHPLRQRHPRAAVAPHLRVERQDHHGRVVRRRGPRRVLRLGRRAARRHAEPPAADGGAVRHGAAGERDAPTRCATRRPRCCMAARPVDPTNFVRGQYRGYRSVHRRGARAPTPRPSAPSGSTSTRPGGVACPSSCGPASPWPRR